MLLLFSLDIFNSVLNSSCSALTWQWTGKSNTWDVALSTQRVSDDRSFSSRKHSGCRWWFIISLESQALVWEGDSESSVFGNPLEPDLAFPHPCTHNTSGLHIWVILLLFPSKSLISLVPVTLSGAWWWQEVGGCSAFTEGWGRRISKGFSQLSLNFLRVQFFGFLAQCFGLSTKNGNVWIHNRRIFGVLCI